MVQLDIDTGDSPPRRQVPRRMSFVVSGEIEKQVDKMLNTGVFKKSQSLGKPGHPRSEMEW